MTADWERDSQTAESVSHSERGRILVVTRNLPPLTGGMERLNWHLAQELGRGFSVRICGPAGSEKTCPDQAPVLATFASRPLPRFLLESLAITLRAALSFKPALVIAGSGITAPHARLVSRLTGARMMVYLHGLDLVADHWLYRALFLPSIRRADQLWANSRNTARLAQQAGIARNRIEILHPGVTLPPAHSDGSPDGFRRAIAAEDRPILLSVGRLTARKGLLEFVQHALPAIVAARPDVLLVVIGGEANERLGAHRANQGEAIRREAERRGVAGHLRLLGRVDDNTLVQAYRASQVHIFPVLDLPSDVEGFGMVAVEAAAHGLPTVAFAAGGVSDAVTAGVSGLLFSPGDYPGLIAGISDLLDGRHAQIHPRGCREFAANFGWERFGECARRVCADLIDGRAGLSDREEPAWGSILSEAHGRAKDQATEPALKRRPHAVIDLSSRYQKARKIERLLDVASRKQPLRLLEVGTGCAGIAHYFATRSEIPCVVDAVDVVDQRSVHDGYRFRLVEGISLPYPDDSFDVVLTNHVIEHVGNEQDQKAHLREIHRVLKGDGIGYLAVPNRWMAVEPHYRLFGLSWLPRSLRTPYLRMRGKGSSYDCEPLSLPKLERMLQETGFRFVNMGTKAFRETVSIEGSKGLQEKVARLLPDAALNLLAHVIPTLVYRLTPIKAR